MGWELGKRGWLRDCGSRAYACGWELEGRGGIGREGKEKDSMEWGGKMGRGGAGSQIEGMGVRLWR